MYLIHNFLTPSNFLIFFKFINQKKWFIEFCYRDFKESYFPCLNSGMILTNDFHI